MEKAIRNTIQKAKVKNQQLEVVYEEYFREDNYSNSIDKKCAQIVHIDLINAFDKLKPHLACICEMTEAEHVKQVGIYDVNDEKMSSYVITGYTHGGSQESAGVTIIGQKLLKSGKVLNLVTPFVQFLDEDAYQFSGELYADIEACDYEVEQYLFGEKWGIKQLNLDFDVPDDVDVSVEVSTSENPKKRSRKKKKIEVKTLDVTA